MASTSELKKLRPLGKLEQLSAACHHLGFFQNVGLSVDYSLPNHLSSSVLDLHQLIFVALANVVRKHGILFAIPVDEDSPNAYFARLESIDLRRSVAFIMRSQNYIVGDEDPELDGILQDQHNTNFKSNYGILPFWRVLIVEDPEVQNTFTACFIFHHAIGDGFAGLIFHNDFQVALDAALLQDLAPNSSSTMVMAPDDIALLPPLEDLHPLPINEDPGQPASNGLKKWTGRPIHAPCVTHYRTLYILSSATRVFIEQCKERGLTVTAALISIIGMEIFKVLPRDVDALTCIVPVNLRPWLNLPKDCGPNSIGTFIDAIKVQLARDAHETDQDNGMLVPHTAHQISAKITKYLTGNPSPSGEPYTAVAIFKNIPDIAAVFNSTLGKSRDAAFEISNLGAFTGAANAGGDTQWQLGRTTFSRSSVVSGSAFTMSIVTGGDGALSIGFSWQENIVDDSLVEELIQGVRRSLDGASW